MTRVFTGWELIVQEEFDELKKKRETLQDFIAAKESNYYQLPARDQQLLRDQFRVMVIYENILWERLNRIKGEVETRD